MQRNHYESPTGRSSGLKNPFFTTLVADDNLSFEAFLEEFFKTEGHFILKADTAEEALESSLRFQPDLILLNQTMGTHSGLSLLPDILTQQPSAAVILMAAHPSLAEAVQAMRLGAVDYLERPLDPEKLRQAIDNQKALFS